MIKNNLKSLMRPEAYPEPTATVDFIQTHVSWVFLTDSHAYKIKKPVDFGFLNFSTIDRRRFYCNEEVRLNRRLCPDIYEGVVEVKQTANGASFNGDGPVIDYAVKMKRLPADRILGQLIEDNLVTYADMIEVAGVIADFHSKAQTSPSISAYGELDRIMFNWIENLEQMIPFQESTLPSRDRDFIKKWVLDFAAGNAYLFKQRVDDGFIRECDGDIHLENICLYNGRTYVFDCIEFNERFRCCDTAADVAFLLMDLDYRGRHDLSEAVIKTYLEISHDRTMMRMMDFYKIYRAFVRGKVESLRLNDSGIDQLDREQAKSRAKKYFRLARGYIERRSLRPTMFITCGLMGAGKSTLAAQLSFELGIRSFNSDTVRKELAGIPPLESAPSPYGEGIYDKKSTKQTYNRLQSLARCELASSRSVIIDASFSSQVHRAAFKKIAATHTADFIIIYLSCSETENRRRLTERSTAGPQISDGRESLLKRQQAGFEPPGETEGRLICINSSKPVESLVNQIYEGME